MKVMADQFIVDSMGRKKAVIVAAKRDEQIMEDLQDFSLFQQPAKRSLA